MHEKKHRLIQVYACRAYNTVTKA